VGDAYEHQIHADMDFVAENLRKRFKHVVYPGLSIPMTRLPGRRHFPREKVDVVRALPGYLLPDYMSLEALAALKDVPLILFSTRLNPTSTPHDYPQVIATAPSSGSAS